VYSVKLADGTELNNLELNGNNFISDIIINDEVFKDNLGTVVVTSEGGSTEHTNMKLVQNKVQGTQSWFILAEKTKEEIEKEELKRQLAVTQEALDFIIMGGM